MALGVHTQYVLRLYGGRSEQFVILHQAASIEMAEQVA
jgi:hypothetical protein